MTIQEAKELNLFTNWNVSVCQNCNQYHSFSNLNKSGSLILCNKCLKKQQGRERKEAQRELFETTLF